MIDVKQVGASFSRSMRIFLRDKAIFGSSLFIPIFFLVVLPQVLFHDAPVSIMPMLKGYLIVSMVVLLIMTTGMSNLAGSIASDRDHDLYSKLSSMPIKPWSESLGRILTVVVFSAMGSTVLTIIGLVVGAQVVVATVDFLVVLGIGFVIVLTVSGIGLIIASFVRSESAASHVGVAIVLVNFFIGIAFPYSDLPEVLKVVARINPIASGSNMITALVLGQDFVGYNPFNFLDVGLMLSLSGIFFIIGLFVYSRFCWRR